MLYAALLLLVIVMLGTAPGYLREHQSWRWPTIEGTITRGYLVPTVWRGMKGFIPRVEYEYEVNGHPFTGHQIDFAPETSIAHPAAERVLLQHPVGSRTMVYYDPDNPAMSVLRPGLTGEQRGILWLGAVCAIVLALGAIFLPRAFQRVTNGPVNDDVDRGMSS